MKIGVFIQFVVDVSLVCASQKLPSVMHKNAPKKQGRGQDIIFIPLRYFSLIVERVLKQN